MIMTKRRINEVEPGEKAYVEPGEYVHPDLEKHMLSPEKIAKAKELKDKMDALLLELEQLRKEIQEKENERYRSRQELSDIERIKPDTLKYLSMIKRDCSEALSEMKKVEQFLFRGIKRPWNPKEDTYEDIPSAFVGLPRSQRKAKDTKEELSNAFDDLLRQSHFKTLRSNSIFCSGDWNQAEGYGEVYLIFPKNGYSVLWSPKYRDLFGDLFSNIPGTSFEHMLTDYSHIESSKDLLNDALRSIINVMYYVQDKLTDDIPNSFYNGSYSEEHPDIKQLAFIKNNSTKIGDFLTSIISSVRDCQVQLNAIKPKIIRDKLLKILQSLKKFDNFKFMKLEEMESVKYRLENAKISDGKGSFFNIFPDAKFASGQLINIISNFLATLKQKPKVYSVDELVRGKMQFTDKDLGEGIREGKEICVSGEYYAFKYSEYNDDFTRFLFREE